MIYGPLCRFLTLLSNKELLFIPLDHKTHGKDELYRQDIIVVNAQPEEIDRFLDGDQAIPGNGENPEQYFAMGYAGKIQPFSSQCSYMVRPLS